MKPITRETKKASWKLKAAVALSVIVALCAFMLSLRFSGKAQKAVPDLTFSQKLHAPVCSLSGGFYSDAQEIVLSSTDPGVKIYYTTDGSGPSLASTLYSKPVIITDRTAERNELSVIPSSPRWKPPIDNVFKGTVLRAIAVDEQNNKSIELARSFFIDPKGRDRYTVPVISFIVDQKDLFGYNKGIYVPGKSYTDKDNYIRKNIPLTLPWWEYPSNYLSRGADAERPAHIELYERDNTSGFEANTGIRINGNATRGFAQKSLRICFREKYGQPALHYPLFDDYPVSTYNSFILRNSGNDWDKTMFRDAFMQLLMKNSHIDIQEYRPCVVFINGEYWGVHNIRERFDEYYLANKYRLDTDSITILELSGKLFRGEKGAEDAFAALLGFIKKNDLSQPENYAYVSSRIDLDSFMDFLIANIYYNNSDWPNNNVKFWKYNPGNVRAKAPKDGKWRWMLYDTDWGFGYNAASTPGSNLLVKATQTGSTGILFSSLLKNEHFMNAFLDRFQQHLNTSFNTAAAINKIDQLQQALIPEMQEHIRRWRAIESYAQWLKNVEVMRDYAQKRPQVQADQLNAFFKLSGSRRITIKK